MAHKMRQRESFIFIGEEVPVHLIYELIFCEAHVVAVGIKYLLWSGILLHKSLVPVDPGLL